MGNEGGFWQAMAIGAGLNLLKNQSDKARADKMNKAAAVQTAYSPHTGMGPGQMTQAGSGLEAAMGGAAQGAMVGQMGEKAGWWGDAAKDGTAAAAAAAPAAATTTAVPIQATAQNTTGVMAPANPQTMVANTEINKVGNDWFNAMGGNQEAGIAGMYNMPKYNDNAWIAGR